MSALHASAYEEAVSPAVAEAMAPANSNTRQDQPTIERKLLLTFFAILAASMVAWMGALAWALLWMVGWV